MKNSTIFESCARPVVMPHCFFFFNRPATTEIYTLSLHDALPIWIGQRALERMILAAQGFLERLQARFEYLDSSAVELAERLLAAHQVERGALLGRGLRHHQRSRSEEHTSELQSPCNLVCRLLLEK